MSEQSGAGREQPLTQISESAERISIPVPGLVYFWTNPMGAVITSAKIDIPFRQYPSSPILDHDTLIEYSSNPQSAGLKPFPDGKFFYLENNSWVEAEADYSTGLTAQLKESLALVMLLNGNTGSLPVLFHIGLNSKKKEGFWAFFDNDLEKKGLPKLLALAAATEIGSINGRIRSVKWLTQIPHGKPVKNPTDFLNRLALSLAEKPQLQQQEVSPKELMAIWRELRSSASQVGNEGITV